MKIRKAQLGIDIKLQNTMSSLLYQQNNRYTPLLKPLTMQLLPYNAGGKELILNIQTTNATSNNTSNVGQIAGQVGIKALQLYLPKAMLLGDSLVEQDIATIFSTGINSAGDTIYNNIAKGTTLTEGLGKNIGLSIKGAATGIAANYIGQGITSAMGNSMLGRFTGQTASTGLSNVKTISNSIKAIKDAKDAAKGSELAKAALLGKANLIGLGMSAVGSGLSAAFGSSKEYGGRYGNITRNMDTAYDMIQGTVGFVPGAGTIISGAMALNKGLSNVFGSTDGMTKQDAILGSAFMPAPVKWLNMAGASKTGTFNNLSWQNTERTNAFMLNSFGDLNKKFDLAREEAGKTYGTFSKGARKKADENIVFANQAWDKILAMTDLNELLNIRSLDMDSINTQRYAQMIQGGWNPVARGKYGMKIFNNQINHSVGMRLLSGAALIDNKQMILSALGGNKVVRPRMKPHRKGELPVYTGEELRQQVEWNAHLEKVRKQQTQQLEELTMYQLNNDIIDKFNNKYLLLEKIYNEQLKKLSDETFQIKKYN